MHISIIIPSWNRAHCLGRALDSVLAQTRLPDEVIVVDDGSDDATRALVTQRYSGAVRYLHQRNRGVSSARNTGIQAAMGDWIALLDSDDEWLPGKLQQQERDLQRNPWARFCHSDEIWVRNGRRVNPGRKHTKHGGRIYRHCLPLCVISPSAALIHREVFTRTGLFDESLPACEDYDLWLRICAVSPVLYIDAPLIVKYGGHPDQLSRRYWGMDRFRIRALEKMLDSGILTAEDRTATLAMLLEKLTIVARGADKHGNPALARQCRDKLADYCRPRRQPDSSNIRQQTAANRKRVPELETPA